MTGGVLAVPSMGSLGKKWRRTMHIVEERACGNSRSTYKYYGPFADRDGAVTFRKAMEETQRSLMSTCCDRTTMQYREYLVASPETVMPNRH